MQTIQTNGTTGSDGTLSLRVPLGQPDTEFEVILVVQPRATANGPPTPDPWADINAFRERLAASGQVFTDSTELIREDRDR